MTHAGRVEKGGFIIFGYSIKVGLINKTLSNSVANLVRMNNPTPNKSRITNLSFNLADDPINRPAVAQRPEQREQPLTLDIS